MLMIRGTLLLLVVVLVSLVWCEGESKNDRLDDLFSLMQNMEQKVGKIDTQSALFLATLRLFFPEMNNYQLQL